MQLGCSKVTQEERQRRIQTGEWLCCGQEGHFISRPVHSDQKTGLVSKCRGIDEPEVLSGCHHRTSCE